MSTGPLRRLAGTLGLMGLVPTAALLATGALEPGEAALRAAVTVALVVALGRATNWWLASTASAFEREAGADEGDPAPDGQPRRRGSDEVEGAAR